jgi:hypothetical protein
MRQSIIIAAAAFIIPSLSMAGGSDAFGVVNKKRQDPKRWMSHQMNQPPPDSGKRYKISQERLEEIRQMFLEAEKDLKKKSANTTAPSSR